MKRKGDEKEIKKILSAKIESSDLEDLWNSLEKKAETDQIRSLRKEISLKADFKELQKIRKSIDTKTENSEFVSFKSQQIEIKSRSNSSLSRIRKHMESMIGDIQSAQLEAREALQSSANRIKRPEFEKMRAKILTLQKYDSQSLKNLL